MLLPAAAARLASLAALLAELLVMTAADSSMPVQSFVVYSAGWQHVEGDPPDEEVLDFSTQQTDCDCMTKCLVRDDCLSYNHDEPSQNCTLFNVRGNESSERRATRRGLRYRQGLAYLGDWCGSDEDCRFLTSAEVTCVANTCSCPETEFSTDKTTCGPLPVVVTTAIPETSATPEDAASPTPEGSISTSAVTTNAEAATTTIAQPAATTEAATTAATTTEAAATTTATTTAATITEAATTAATTTEAAATTTATTTAATITEAATTAATTTEAAATTTATTTAATTTEATTTTSVATTTTPAPIFSIIYQSSNEFTSGRWRMSCKKPENNKVMAGFMNNEGSEGDGNDIDRVRCVEFLGLPDLVIGPKDAQIDMDEPPLDCAAGSVLVSVMDDTANFYRPESMTCAPVESPYTVDTGDCEEVTVNDPATEFAMGDTAGDLRGDWPFQCPQLPDPAGIVSLDYRSASNGEWKGMKCCRIKLAP